VLELGLPVVVAVNMMDIAASRGLQLDLEKLHSQVPVKFVPVQAHRGQGIQELKQALAQAIDEPASKVASPFPAAFQEEVAQLEKRTAGSSEPLPRYLAERLLLDTSGYLASIELPGVTQELLAELPAARERLLKAGLPVPAVEAMARYQWAAGVLQAVVTRPQERPDTFTDRVDRWLTHWFTGTLTFLLVMFVMFQSISLVSEPSATATDAAVAMTGDFVSSIVPEGPLQSLLVNGVIAGVGGVIVFVPQILTLFLFIAILEDCGYMARAAYLMDKLMVRVGLSGKSFIPLLSSFACAIPGIMAARVIENRRDRLVTILVAPLMSCSARLPVYVLLIGTFIPDRWFWGFISLQALVMFAMYLVGALTGIAVAWILKKTILRGPTPPFVLELPTYKWPGPGVVLHRMFEQGWAFVYRAGTLILLISVIVWALSYFPHDPSVQSPEMLARVDELKAIVEPQQEALEELQARYEALEEGSPEALALKPELDKLQGPKDELDEIQNHIAGRYLETSYLGQMGKAIEPAVRPLGWDWKLGAAAIASFPAREVVVATLGTIYNLGEADEESEPLRQQLKEAKWAGTDRPVYTIPVALSVMVFFALCAQCASTLAIMYRETGSVRWPVFTFTYMTTLAYLGALLTYQVGTYLETLWSK
jgi:ferrous iron transport protein B